MGCIRLDILNNWYQKPELTGVLSKNYLTLEKTKKKARRAYRFAFNGKEHDPELKGKHNVQDYGFRMNDTRLGRFFTVDPLRKDYPWYTPYQFAGNKPIVAIDLDGLEEKVVILDIYRNSEGNYFTQSTILKNDGVLVNGQSYENVSNTEAYGKRGTLTVVNIHDVQKANDETSTTVTFKHLSLSVKDKILNFVETRGGEESQKDGLVLVSKTGGGMSNKNGYSSLNEIDADLLLAALGSIGNPGHNKNVAKVADVVEVALESIKTVINAHQKGETLSSEDALNTKRPFEKKEDKNEDMKAPDTLKCNAGCKIPMEGDYKTEASKPYHASNQTGSKWDTIKVEK